MTAILLIPILNLWYHSGHSIPALLALLAWVIQFRQKRPKTLKKWVYYVALLPFMLWWFIVPSGERFSGVPQLLFYIPGWYFITLGLIHAFSLGSGGQKNLLWWNGGAALLVSGMEGTPVFYSLAMVYFFAVLVWIRHDRPSSQQPWGRLLVVVCLAVSLALMGSWVRQQVRPQSHWLESKQMRGFSPNSFLGSFAQEYASPYENQIVIRLYGSQGAEYLRGAVYQKYRSSGLWTQDSSFSWQFPIGQQVEFSIFGDTSQAQPLWIYSSVNTYGYLLLPPHTRAVSVKADSVSVHAGLTWQSTPHHLESGWFAWVAPPSQEPAPTSLWLSIPRRVLPQVQQAIQESQLDSSQNPHVQAMALISWFSKEFTYSTQPTLLEKNDPLASFLKFKRGYCEYFATLTTLVLRAHGIPARYVTGFAGPTASGNNMWVYRRRDAHAWVEYYYQGQWHLLDPTPPGARPFDTQTAFWEGWLESVQNRMAWWLHWIRDGEWKLRLEPLQAQVQSWLSSVGLYIIGGVILLGFWARRWWIQKKSTPPMNSHVKHWASLLAKAESELARLGFRRQTGETVGHFLQNLPAQVPEKPVQILRQYQKNRFRRTP